MIHPNEALHDAGTHEPPALSPCEHFAGHRKFIQKAFEIQNERGPIFDITIDLEDGARQGLEQENLDQAIEFLNSDLNQHKRAGVRIHDPNHEWWDREFTALVEATHENIAYILVPKSYVKYDILKVVNKMNSMGRRIPLHALIETQQARRNVYEIASVPQLEALDFGLMDFTADHNGAVIRSAMWSPEQFDHALIRAAKVEMVSAALLNGLVPSHNVTLDTMSRDTAFADARRARNEFGFLRMWSIFPTQIDAIIEAMSPDHTDVERAAGVLMAAQEASWGPIKYEGCLEDRATYRLYWSMLKRAKAAGRDITSDVMDRFFA